jgi:hypothetical protein
MPRKDADPQAIESLVDSKLGPFYALAEKEPVRFKRCLEAIFVSPHALERATPGEELEPEQLPALFDLCGANIAILEDRRTAERIRRTADIAQVNVVSRPQGLQRQRLVTAETQCNGLVLTLKAALTGSLDPSLDPSIVAQETYGGLLERFGALDLHTQDSLRAEATRT